MVPRPLGSISSLLAIPQLVHTAYPTQPFVRFAFRLRAGGTAGFRNPPDFKAGLYSAENQTHPLNKYHPQRMAGLLALLPHPGKQDHSCPIRGLQCRSSGHRRVWLRNQVLHQCSNNLPGSPQTNLYLRLPGTLLQQDLGLCPHLD